MQASMEDTLWTWRWQHGNGRLVFITGKLLEFWQFLFGAALSGAFVLLVWSRPYSLIVRILQTAIFLLIQSLAIFRFVFWPTPSFGYIITLLFALILQLGLLFAIFTDKWNQLASALVVLTAIGIALETWRFHSHYAGPIVALAIALVINSLRNDRAKVYAWLLPLLILGTTAAESSRPPGLLDQWAKQRSKMQQRLEAFPGQQLVFVFYRPGHDLYEEWVQNRAVLDAAPVVWARSRSAEENCKLIKFFSNRKVWSLDADRGLLQPYSTDCLMPGGPDELVPNQ
jgi:hypothetical protein